MDGIDEGRRWLLRNLLEIQAELVAMTNLLESRDDNLRHKLDAVAEDVRALRSSIRLVIEAAYVARIEKHPPHMRRQ